MYDAGRHHSKSQYYKIWGGCSILVVRNGIFFQFIWCNQYEARGCFIASFIWSTKSEIRADTRIHQLGLYLNPLNFEKSPVWKPSYIIALVVAQVSKHQAMLSSTVLRLAQYLTLWRSGQTKLYSCVVCTLTWNTARLHIAFLALLSELPVYVPKTQR